MDNNYFVRKRKIMHDQIRSQFLNQYFNRMRAAILKGNDIQSQFTHNQISLLVSELPENVIKILSCIGPCASLLTQKLIESSDQWLKKCQSIINLNQWTLLIQLITKLIKFCCFNSAKLQLIESSSSLICLSITSILQSNKMMKYQILMLIMDFYLQNHDFIVKLSMIHIKTFVYAIGQLLNLDPQSHSCQLLKAVYLCNILVSNEAENSLAIDLLLGDWTILKIIRLLQNIYRYPLNSLLIQLISVILTTLINITFSVNGHKKSKLLHQLSQSQFISFVAATINNPIQNQSNIFILYLTLIVNLMHYDSQFQNSIVKIIDFKKLKIFNLNRQIEQLIEDIFYFLKSSKIDQ